MYKPKTIKTFALIAIILSVIGLLVSIILTKRFSGLFIMAVASWVILLWASYIGFKLSSYQLYEDEYKKVGIRIYLIIVAFILFFFVGLMIGLILSVILLATLWGLKRNYDEWDYSDVPNTTDTTKDNQ